MRTSYSAIGTYLQCPQKYKFQEIDRIRVPKGREAIFGSLVHSTLKFMFQRDPLFPTLDEVISYFRGHWPPHEIFEAESKNDPFKRAWSEEDEKAYFEEGVRMLKNFYEKNAPWNYTIVDLESRFEVVLQDEKIGETHILAGIIDRIDKLPDGTYEIIDYKTSKRMPSQETLNRDLQLSLYSLGLQKRWPHLTANDIKLSLYFLKHGEKLSTRATPEATRKTKEHILKTISEIQEKLRSEKEFEPIPGPLCDWCVFRPICPAWKHLYRKSQITSHPQEARLAPGGKSQIEIEDIVKEYFELKKERQKNADRLEELQRQVKEYMDTERITSVFGKDGVISRKTVQRYEYDWKKVKAVLSPLGKWEEILKVDDIKLRRVMREIPEEVLLALKSSRLVSKEYTILTASTKRFPAP